MAEQEQEVFELTDLDVESVGLVLRGANKRPFFVIKSDTKQEVEQMSENEDFAAILDELEGVTEVNESAWSRLVGVVKSVLTKPAPEPEPEPETETSSEEGDTVDFAQVIEQAKREVAEEFAAKLEREREARQKVEEAFAQEQKKRRLAEFAQVAEGYTSLPGKGEEFAADLMAVANADAEVYERLSAILKAADEAIEKGALFEQFSVAGGDVSGDPFEAAVEARRQERFADEDVNTGWVKAFDQIRAERPELARAYATH